MTSEQTFTLIASAAFLGLAALAAIRGAKNPLALPLALLCVDLFAYNSLEVLGSISGSPRWEWLESLAAALAAPLLVHFTLVFLGLRREQRALLFVTYAYFGLVAASCLLPFALPSLGDYPGGGSWALAMLIGVLPVFSFLGVLLVRHYLSTGSADERARTQLFIATIVLGVGGPVTDLLWIAGASSSPRLSAGGLLLSAVLLTALTLRVRLLRGTAAVLVVTAVVVGFLGVVAHLMVFRWLGRETALLVMGTVAVTLILLGAARTVWSAFTTYRERAAHLATLGRLSAQMAHDIRNPLAAIRGAAQYLQTERERGGRLEEQGELLELIVDQADRLERVVRDYQRLGRAQPVRVETDVEELVARVASGARVSEKAASAKVEVRAEVEDDVGMPRIDPDLVAAALENLSRNALEAMEGARGSVVRVAARRRTRSGRESLVLSVEDDGPGMDARTRAQAEEAFFTTKAEGSGLGLAFVRRVAEAHGGTLRVESRQGHGTTVTMVLPLDERPSLDAVQRS